MPEHYDSIVDDLSTTDSARTSYDVYLGLNPDTRLHVAQCGTETSVEKLRAGLEALGIFVPLSVVPRNAQQNVSAA